MRLGKRRRDFSANAVCKLQCCLPGVSLISATLRQIADYASYKTFLWFTIIRRNLSASLVSLASFFSRVAPRISRCSFFRGTSATAKQCHYDVDDARSVSSSYLMNVSLVKPTLLVSLTISRRKMEYDDATILHQLDRIKLFFVKKQIIRHFTRQ